jgi:HD-GYP domain-containing protein (c-di-GMP phosphodiesterase class II)
VGALIHHKKRRKNRDMRDFADRLIAWQRHHGRHDLPWQGTRDPYRIWLSEIMLQQTQVDTVIPYYQRFLAHFPDVASLAAAPVEDVMALWSGLGYYARARNLHRAARTIIEAHGGAFPRSAALARRYGYDAAAAFPLCTGSETLGVLFIAAATPQAFTAPELEVLQELAGDLACGIDALRGRQARARREREHVAALERMKGLLGNTVLALATAVEARDPHSGGNQLGVMEVGVGIGRELGWEEERIEALGIAALVHDVGNICVPAEILGKPGRLSAPEFELVKGHPHIGHKILSSIDFAWPVAEMVLQHHEMIDGSGYPSGLKAGAILPEAQVIGIAGMVEAMSSHRSYRPALGVSAALEELERLRGVKFNAQLVDACLHLFRAKGYRLACSGEGLAEVTPGR